MLATRRFEESASADCLAGKSAAVVQLLPPSALRRYVRGLPVHGGDKRFEADSPDDLFEGAVVAVRRDEEGADRDLRGVLEIFTGQPAQAKAGGRGSLQKQRADVRLLVTVTTQLDGVMGLLPHNIQAVRYEPRPSWFCNCSGEMPLEWVAIQERRPEPDRQRQLAGMHDRAGGHRGLPTAIGAL
jgi:hypothetical protein